MDIKQGDLFFADLGSGLGSELSGERPVLVVSNDIMNKFSPTVIVTLITGQLDEPRLPTHIKLQRNEGVFSKDSVLLLEHIRTIDKNRLTHKIGSLSPEKMSEVADSWGFNTMLGEENFMRYIFTDETFIHGNSVSLEEDYEYEFKEIRNDEKPRNVIADKIIPYVAAFLNDNGGRILFGIRNSDRVVTAFKASSDEKDDIRQLINNKILDAIHPRVSPSAYSIRFHNVYSNDKEELIDTYVLEVNIHPPVHSNIVYFVEKHKIYSKVNGGKKPLEWSAIQDFIQRKSIRLE